MRAVSSALRLSAPALAHIDDTDTEEPDQKHNCQYATPIYTYTHTYNNIYFSSTEWCANGLSMCGLQNILQIITGVKTPSTKRRITVPIITLLIRPYVGTVLFVAIIAK